MNKKVRKIAKRSLRLSRIEPKTQVIKIKWENEKEMQESLSVQFEGISRELLSRKLKGLEQAPEGFCDRVLRVLSKLQDELFGLNYHVSPKKTFKNDTSNQSLVNAIQDYEKFSKENHLINEQLDWYGFIYPS